ncbi:uncharacterized protein LOC129145144 [Talpa occidentalis]|uniref:uncharacterized protein LOC129145144 n=1 Tax=Talpa occidentalis TaxID=50954 RepID=UPI0023F93CCC|nr:uncharacterized protein LOC129145144 [Talpa occidentalis]
MDSSRSSSWFPTQTLMLLLFLAIPLPGSQTAKDPSFPCTLERAVGESVQLLPSCSSCPETSKRLSGTGIVGTMEHTCWCPGGLDTSTADWYEIEEKYKSRLFLTEMGFLNITNLIMEMSGVYTVRTKLRQGPLKEEAFRLCVYEPIPHPQIRIHSSSHTSSWCKVSLECGVPGATRNLTVAWESQDLSRELEQSGALGVAPNPGI